MGPCLLAPLLPHAPMRLLLLLLHGLACLPCGAAHVLLLLLLPPCGVPSCIVLACIPLGATSLVGRHVTLVTHVARMLWLRGRPLPWWLLLQRRRLPARLLLLPWWLLLLLLLLLLPPRLLLLLLLLWPRCLLLCLIATHRRTVRHNLPLPLAAHVTTHVAAHQQSQRLGRHRQGLCCRHARWQGRWWCGWWCGGWLQSALQLGYGCLCCWHLPLMST